LSKESSVHQVPFKWQDKSHGQVTKEKDLMKVNAAALRNTGFL